MKLFVLICLCACSSISYSQQFRGSFIITAICKDGIVMGADSRLSFYNVSTRKPIGYVDSIQKIFAGKNYILGLMGAYTFDTYNLSSLTKSFTDSAFYQERLSSTWGFWLEYISKTAPTIKKELDSTTIFIAGYNNKVPNIFVSDNKGTINLKSKFFEPAPTSFGENYKPTMTCKQAVSFIRDAIYKYAKDSNRQNVIGGPIYFIKITKKNKVRWLSEKPPREYKRITDFMKDINYYENK